MLKEIKIYQQFIGSTFRFLQVGTVLLITITYSSQLSQTSVQIIYKAVRSYRRHLVTIRFLNDSVGGCAVGRNNLRKLYGPSKSSELGFFFPLNGKKWVLIRGALSCLIISNLIPHRYAQSWSVVLKFWLELCPFYSASEYFRGHFYQR